MFFFRILQAPTLQLKTPITGGYNVTMSVQYGYFSPAKVQQPLFTCHAEVLPSQTEGHHTKSKNLQSCQLHAEAHRRNPPKSRRMLPSGKCQCHPVPRWTLYFPPEQLARYLKMYLNCRNARSEEELHMSDSSLNSSPEPSQNPSSSTPHKEKWQVKTRQAQRYKTGSFRVIHSRGSTWHRMHFSINNGDIL